ncbi:MAG: hypothetical protein ACXVZ2_13360 [Gaiellaceae bacterium]
MRKLLWLVPLVAVAAWLGYRHYEGQRLEHRLGTIATSIARRPVGVNCQGETGALLDVGPELGTVEFDAEGHPAGHTDLKRQVCGWLARLPGGSVANAATAVEVLAHESYHLAGFQDEATAECYALQTMPYVAQQFHATSQQIRTWVAYSFARYPSMPEEYVSPDCTPGGRLDLHSSESIWPST